MLLGWEMEKQFRPREQREWPSGRREYGTSKNHPEREDTQGGQAGSTRKLKGFTGARLYELNTMEENINRFVSFNF